MKSNNYDPLEHAVYLSRHSKQFAMSSKHLEIKEAEPATEENTDKKDQNSKNYYLRKGKDVNKSPSTLLSNLVGNVNAK